MRTRTMYASAALLPLLLVGLASAPGAGQDGAGTPGASQAQGQTVHTGNRTIAAGEVVDDIVVVGGDLRVAGEVRQNAVVVGGNLILEVSGLIGGDAVVTGGDLLNEGGSVGGEMRTIGGPGLDIAQEIQRAIGGVAAADDGASSQPTGSTARSVPQSQSRNRTGFFTPIGRGIAGIVAMLALGAVLAGVGSALVFYARPYLETVSDTVRGSTIRSGATGLAASVLAIPAFLVLIVALIVSIIGIPFLLVAVPLYPVALFAAGIYGLLAVTHAIGERTAEQSRDRMDLRYRNSYAYVLTGVTMLLLPHVAAHLISMTGFLRFIGTMLQVVTWIAIWAAATIGFGAVILSRGGTRRTFAAPMSPGFPDDDLLDEDPLGRNHV